MFPIRTILHPTDFSEPSRYAFQVACALAKDHGAKLLVVHAGAIPAIAYNEGVLDSVVVPLDLENYKAEMTAKLHEVCPADPQVLVEHRLEIGPDPVREIVRVAESEGCDLIVMGTHGRTGLRRILMGSVAEYVMRKAPCPVLTVRGPLAPAQAAETPSAENAAIKDDSGIRPRSA
jgi:nucleotide-binding universal stress UspA family protein